MIETLTAFLVWLSAAPSIMEAERPRCAAAVTLARCSMVRAAEEEEAEPPEVEQLVTPGGTTTDCKTGNCKTR